MAKPHRTENTVSQQQCQDTVSRICSMDPACKNIARYRVTHPDTGKTTHHCPSHFGGYYYANGFTVVDLDGTQATDDVVADRLVLNITGLTIDRDALLAAARTLEPVISYGLKHDDLRADVLAFMVVRALGFSVSGDPESTHGGDFCDG